MYALFTFGEKEHIQAFRNDGLLVKPLSEFAKIDLDIFRWVNWRRRR